SRIRGLSEEDYTRVGEIGFQNSLKGMHFMLAGCLAAIEVMEGAPRELRRKRRVWEDVQPALSVPDPRLTEINERIDADSGGEPVKKREVFDGLVATLQPHLSQFRYFKSFAHFRRSFGRGTSYIGLVRGHGVVELRFGVLHTDVEKVIVHLFGEPSYDLG